MIYSQFSFCLVCCNVCCAAPPAMLLCGSDSSSCFAGTVFTHSLNSWLSEIFAEWVEAEPCFTDRQRPQAKVWRMWERRNPRVNFLGRLSHSKGEKLSKEPLHHGSHRDEIPWLNPSPPREAGPAEASADLPQAMQEKSSGTDINQSELENRLAHSVTNAPSHLQSSPLGTFPSLYWTTVRIHLTF